MLDFGKLIRTGSPEEIRRDEYVREAYIGEGLQVLDGLDSPPVLSLRNVEAGYGQAKALFGISFDVGRGEVVSLLGVNGAGKSTVARAVTGLIPKTGGSIHFGQVDITQWAPQRLRRLGLGYLPEERGISRDLSVIDNLRVAARTIIKGKVERRDAIELAFSSFPILGQRRQQQAGLLSGGEQQMLALARVLIAPLELLVADEVSLGLGPVIVDQVYANLEAARARGVSILLIEQFIHRALGIADRCVVLRRGSVAWCGEAGSAGVQVIGKYLE